MEGNVWYIHTLKYTSAIEDLKILIYAVTGMNLKNMLSERNQTQKATYYTIPFRVKGKEEMTP